MESNHTEEESVGIELKPRERAFPTWNLGAVALLMMLVAAAHSVFRPDHVTLESWSVQGASANSVYTASLVWIGTSFFFLAATLGAGGFALSSLCRDLGTMGTARRPILGIVVGALLLYTAYRVFGGFTTYETILAPIRHEISTSEVLSRYTPAFKVFSVLGEITGFVLAVALTASITLPRSVEPGRLALAVRRHRRLLYVGAAFFVAGIAQVGATYGWMFAWYEVAADAPEGYPHPLERVGQLAFPTASVYTVWLLAMYLPGAAYVRDLAERMAAAATSSSVATEQSEWLEKNGLGNSMKGFSLRFVALLSPVFSTALLDLLGGMA